MNIRTFQLSDYRVVADLMAVALSEECCEETMGALARQLSWDSELVLVAEKGDSIIGLMIGTIDHNKGYVYRLAVHPDYRRQGVGKTLVSAMNVRFRQRNVLKVLIAGDKHNEQLLPFYESLKEVTLGFAKLAKPLSIMAI
ncbi:GNAT family N-acetyltransferase [Cohnella thailandensis]|jgi:Acetyltransferases|uniref:GNAT family N-acetyltransferase n=1 Tax=Cohnella thailandensis TaxID=557557 RepID=A0A841T6P7_9BACL|nr:GNAT family N-acetyltransferase [Cohnella thailandensis]MBB6637968.1 GNAT family N-acetyltransferase [Cohnella thailandensis]MBP1976893.1 ribosomal protein S18 acetylase RimI-like enzyme [Cohnella thailandensis]